MTRIAVFSALLLCIFAATVGVCPADFCAVQSELQTIFDPSHPYDGSKWTVTGNGSVAWLDDSWLVVSMSNVPGERLWLEATFHGAAPQDIPFLPCIVTDELVEPDVTTRTGQTIRWEWVLGAGTAWPPPVLGDDPEVLALPVADFNLDIGLVDLDYNTYPVATFDFGSVDIHELRLGAGGPTAIPAPGGLLLCGMGLGCVFVRRQLRR